MAMPSGLEQRYQIRILLVSGHPAFRGAASRLLKRYDELVMVGIAQGDQEALARAEQLRPDVILLDLDGTGQSGLETISLLRIRLPETGIIALSLLDMADYREAALAVGANALIPKVNLIADLLRAIRAVARTGRIEEESS